MAFLILSLIDLRNLSHIRYSHHLIFITAYDIQPYALKAKFLNYIVNISHTKLPPTIFAFAPLSNYMYLGQLN